jgi:hypothetical protein
VPEPAHKEEGRKQFLHMTTRSNNSEFQKKIHHGKAPLSNFTVFSLSIANIVFFSHFVHSFAFSKSSSFCSLVTTNFYISSFDTLIKKILCVWENGRFH